MQIAVLTFIICSVILSPSHVSQQCTAQHLNNTYRTVCMSMALYPPQNSSFCMQHCCFELMLALPFQYLTSIIQHCTFTIQHSCLKIQYSTSLIQHCALTIQRPYFKYYLHATFVCVFYRCSIDQKMSLLTPVFRSGV